MTFTDCDYTVHFYGAMFREGDVWICMEVNRKKKIPFNNECCVELERYYGHFKTKIKLTIYWR
jgi:hypothetical protein